MRNSFSSKQNKNLINVLFSFDGRDQYARPVRLTWEGVDYDLGGVQFWYAEHRGGVLVHHYQLSDIDRDYMFEISLETENLIWNLDKAKSLAGVVEFRSQLIGALS